MPVARDGIAALQTCGRLVDDAVWRMAGLNEDGTVELYARAPRLDAEDLACLATLLPEGRPWLDAVDRLLPVPGLPRPSGFSVTLDQQGAITALTWFSFAKAIWRDDSSTSRALRRHAGSPWLCGPLRRTRAGRIRWTMAAQHGRRRLRRRRAHVGAGRPAADMSAPSSARPTLVACRVVAEDGTVREDDNGFVVALAARAVRRSGDTVPPSWLDHLEACRRADDSFGFWPECRAPSWAPALPGDADDTAVDLLELLRAGRVGRDAARAVACRTVARFRLIRPPDPGPPWLRRGAFTTWHRPGAATDLVDLTVLLNVLALLSDLELMHLPGVRASLDTVAAAREWAGDSRDRWRSVSPFYPEPDELAHAVDNAEESGVPGLDGLAAHLRHVAPRDPDLPYAVCSAPYGPPVWHSEDLRDLRGHVGVSGR